MTHYVLGFMFTPSGNEVVLIEKLRSEWQKGKLNGVGGHIEEGEAPREAMEREFYEETGIKFFSWEQFGTMGGKGWLVTLFRAHSNLACWAESKTDEAIGLYGAFELPPNVISNLRYLIPAALDSSISDLSIVMGSTF